MKTPLLLAVIAMAGLAAIAHVQPVRAQGCPPNSVPVSEKDNVVRCRCISGFENRGGVCVRTAEPANKDMKFHPAAVARVESRGEFHVLTRDGRELTGKDANLIPLEEGTRVVTGKSGHVRMKLPDDTTFTIGPGSCIVIDSFVYDPDNTPKKVVANMTKGVFRWVTGKVKPHKGSAEMKVRLPVMAVGIRGTDFEAAVNPDGSGYVVLHHGQLDIAAYKTGSTFMLNAGYKVTFKADGSVSRPMKTEFISGLSDL